MEHFTLRLARVTGRALPDAPLEPVFADTGVYSFRISGEAKVEASRVCAVRLTRPLPR